MNILMRRRRCPDLGAEMVADRIAKLRIPIIKALADVNIQFPTEPSRDLFRCQIFSYYRKNNF
jgi:hypothetical protein